MSHISFPYRIAGKFQGRKLPRIGEKYDFRGEKFEDCSLSPHQQMPRPQILRRKLSRIAINCKICKSFSLKSFPLYGINCDSQYGRLHLLEYSPLTECKVRSQRGALRFMVGPHLTSEMRPGASWGFQNFMIPV